MTSAHTDAAVMPALSTRTRRHRGTEGGGSAPATGCTHEGAGVGTQQSGPPVDSPQPVPSAWTLGAAQEWGELIQVVSSPRSSLAPGAGPDGSTQNEDLCLSPPVCLPTCTSLSAAPRPAQRLPAWASLTAGVPRAGGRPFSTQIPSCVSFPGNCKNPSTSECFLDPVSSSGNLRTKQNRRLADAWRRARRQLWGSCLGHSRLTGTWTDCDSGCQGRGSVLLHTPRQPWGP